ncbi:MAG: hypothetical protein ACI8RN_002938 [Glaciecola sp.]|jgi:hypothetical protein
MRSSHGFYRQVLLRRCAMATIIAGLAATLIQVLY